MRLFQNNLSGILTFFFLRLLHPQGVLGDGGEWAAVAGSDGRMSDERTTLPRPPPIPPSPLRRVSSEFLDANIPPPIKPELPAKAPMSNVSNLPQRPREQQLYYTNVSVEKYFNGQIVFDDPALAEWSVDAMAIVRNQLYRAANGKVSLPGTANWSEGSSLSYDVPGPVALDPSDEMDVTNESVVPPRLPLWAKASNIPSFEEEDQGNESTNNHNRVIICDLPLMVAEVSDLLDVMESIMSIQRSRRLDKLKPPHWIRQNWYISAIAFPSFSYLLYKTTSKGYGWVFLKYTAQKFVGFFREHVVDPFFAMYVLVFLS